MSRASVEVSIAPDVFRWLCGTSGWPAKDIAKRIEVPEEDVRSWCEGKTKPVLPLSKVEQLSSAFKRPLAAFLLSKPPEEIKTIPDFRKLPSAQGDFSKETHLAIRKARRLQKVRRELMENLGSDVQVKVRTRTLRDDPEVVAREERTMSGIHYENKTGITDFVIFNTWRDWFEQKNIAVFKMRMPIDDARGFVLSENEPFVIVVNASDAHAGKMFTLFHEYGHLLLNVPAICNQDSNEVKDHRIAEIERWCNKFAGAFLMPKEAIEANYRIMNAIRAKNFAESAKIISKKFFVSKESALLRLLTLDYISSKLFFEERDKFRKEVARNIESIKERQKESEQKFIAQPLDKQCLSEKGHNFVSLVLKNTDLGYITSNDALDYLDIKLRHLEKLRA
jgi:Zn-dependent peptidase ImmA (M78 family)